MPKPPLRGARHGKKRRSHDVNRSQYTVYGYRPIARNWGFLADTTYKLGLLRTLVRIAETAPGLVIKRTDDHMEIPFGAVGLYWLKQYVARQPG